MFDDALVDPITKVIYHLEERPNDGSCGIIDTRAKEDILSLEYSARNSVNDYGGAAAIVYGGIVYFSNEADSSIYAIDVNDQARVPRRVTPRMITLTFPP